MEKNCLRTKYPKLEQWWDYKKMVPYDQKICLLHPIKKFGGNAQIIIVFYMKSIK